MHRGAWWAIVHGLQRVGHDLVTKTFAILCRASIIKLSTYWRKSLSSNLKFLRSLTNTNISQKGKGNFFLLYHMQHVGS